MPDNASMPTKPSLRLGFLLCTAVAAFALATQAAEPTKKPMKMDETMAGEMKKDGMKKGDGKKAAAKKAKEMKPSVEQEGKTMPRPAAGK